jgi:ubiquinol-cytochrome c reductase cytochrome b subunit
MVAYVKNDLKETLEPADVASVVTALSAEAGLASQQEGDSEDLATAIAEGRALIVENCASCHTFRGKGSHTGPDLTGYGSRQWLTGIIWNPGHARFYGKQATMPPYGAPPDPAAPRLSPEQIEGVADWLRGE